MSRNPTFLSANFTILGHFNPAILTHGFLVDTCGFSELGEPTSQSPREIGVVSEIVYDKFRWFMDLNRMIVENRALINLREFTSPGLGMRYLDILPYTPLTAAGINLNVDFCVADPTIFWSNFGNPDVFIPPLKLIKATAVEIASHCRLSDRKFVLDHGSLAFNPDADVRISLQVTNDPSGKLIRAALNYEWRNLKTQKEKLKKIAETYLDAAHTLLAVMQTISEVTP